MEHEPTQQANFLKPAVCDAKPQSKQHQAQTRLHNHLKHLTRLIHPNESTPQHPRQLAIAQSSPCKPHSTSS